MDHDEQEHMAAGAGTPPAEDSVIDWGPEIGDEAADGFGGSDGPGSDLLLPDDLFPVTTGSANPAFQLDAGLDGLFDRQGVVASSVDRVAVAPPAPAPPRPSRDDRWSGGRWDRSTLGMIAAGFVLAVLALLAIVPHGPRPSLLVPAALRTSTTIDGSPAAVVNTTILGTSTTTSPPTTVVSAAATPTPVPSAAGLSAGEATPSAVRVGPAPVTTLVVGVEDSPAVVATTVPAPTAPPFPPTTLVNRRPRDTAPTSTPLSTTTTLPPPASADGGPGPAVGP